jgi:membrane protein
MSSPAADPRPPANDPAQAGADEETVVRHWWRRPLDGLRRVARNAAAGGLTRTAAALTYYLVLAIFPALIIVAGLLSAVGLSPHDVDALLDAAGAVGPDWVVGLVHDSLHGVLSSGSAPVAIGAGALLALWTASGYVSAFLWAAEQMEGRKPQPFLRQLPARLGLATLVLLLLAACGAAIVLAGPFATWLGDLLGIGDAVLTAWSWLKWPLLFGVALLVLLLLYRSAARHGTRWRSLLGGAAAGVIMVLVASAGFSVYLTHFASYNKVYGALATGVAFLVWAWLVNAAAVLGFLVTVALEGDKAERQAAPDVGEAAGS